MDIKKINEIMQDLAKERPIFHSEADFQFALAWKIKEHCQNAEVRLEHPIEGLELPGEKNKRRQALDLLIRINDAAVAIELKYITKKNVIYRGADGEEYNLKGQGDPSWNRYNYIKDVWRLKQFFLKDKDHNSGYAILLSNDEKYKEPVDGENASKGLELTGKIKGCYERIPPNSPKQKAPKIDFKESEYTIEKSQYSTVAVEDNGKPELSEFYYLIVKVG
jgi:hypothetical protein